MRKIGIIGVGFTGTMTAVHLINKASWPFEIILINERQSLNRGIAYNPYSNKQLLKAPAGKMSAYVAKQEHFVEWAQQQKATKEKDINLAANPLLPRQLEE